MADQFDQAQDCEARENAAALKVHQALAAKAAENAPKPTGECLNPLCGEPLEGERLFCGAPCAKEHAKRVK